MLKRRLAWIVSSVALAVLVASPAAAQLGTEGHQWFGQFELGGTEAEQNRFGEAGAAGDFNGDGFADLAISAPGKDVDGEDEAGMIYIVNGTAAGLDLASTQTFTQLDTPICSLPEPFDHFGEVLAAGDFDRDGHDDLAVGLPGENFAGLDDGIVQIFYGSAAGLTAVGNQCFWASVGGPGGLQGTPTSNDNFGAALAVGDFNWDTYPDLAIGAPREEPNTLGAAPDTGAVFVVYGSASGLDISTNQFITQDNTGILDAAETGDRFGAALASLNVTGIDEFRPDLAIGIPGEEVLGPVDSGAVQIIRGAGFGLGLIDQFFNREVLGVPGPDGSFELGEVLATGNFDCLLGDDLAIGVPNDDVGGATGGTVSVLFSDGGALTGSGSQYIDQFDFPGFGTESEDQFGAALAAGSFNGLPHCDDLAIGAPGETLVGQPANHGFVHVLSASLTGLAPASDSGFFHGDFSEFGFIGVDIGLGAMLVSGEFAGPGASDLVGGSPSHDIFTDHVGSAVRIPGPTPIFADGFESGDVSAWSTSQ